MRVLRSLLRLATHDRGGAACRGARALRPLLTIGSWRALTGERHAWIMVPASQAHG